MVLLPGDWKAVERLRENADTSNGPLAFEAPPLIPTTAINSRGGSALSPVSTLLGWGGHEGQWRGNIDEQPRVTRYPCDFHLIGDGAKPWICKSGRSIM